MKGLSIFFVFVLLISHFTTPSAGQMTKPAAPLTQTGNQSKTLIRAFENFLKKKMVSGKVPAVSVGFVKDDFFWANGYGLADLENKIPATAESSYRLASVTKPMTALAILQLAEKGKINLDAEIQTYVPYFPKKKWNPTVRQLLGHLGGIDDYRSPWEERLKEPKTTRESIAIFENFDLVFEPGTEFYYTSYGYNLLGAAIETASGKSWEEYMRENVWLPAGMKDARADSPVDLIPNRVRGYRLLDNKIKNSEFVDVRSRLAAGGIRVTVPDMLRFGKAVIDGKLLSRPGYEMMFDSMTTRAGRMTDYGMGWRVAPQNGQFVVTHNGAQPETATALYVYPAKKIAIAVASNLEGAEVDFFAQKLFEFLTGEGSLVEIYETERGDKSPAAITVQDVFESGRGYFYRHQKSLTENHDDLAKSFAYLNQTLDDKNLAKTDGEALQKARAGKHPAANQAFVKIGSYIAQKLFRKYGAKRLASYSNDGATAFFYDYVELYKTDEAIPKEFRFDESLEKRIVVWQKSWARTKVGGNFEIEAATNVSKLLLRVRKTFSNEPIYPNLSGEMIKAMEKIALENQIEKALEIGALIEEIYPRLENPSRFHGIYGAVLLVSGDQARGRKYLNLAHQRNANGVTSAARLNRLAQGFAAAKMLDQAVTLMRFAVELHPKSAGLQYNLGELYLKKGLREKAIEAYKKSLEINPNFPDAPNAREILDKLVN